MAIGRVVRRELLDDLPPHDPEAQRSRRDLRVINSLMGNFIWISRQLRAFSSHTSGGVAEIGAGEGLLCQHLRSAFPDISLTGLDLAPRPDGLSPCIAWEQDDIFTSLPRTQASALTGVMIAHHFSEEALSTLAPLLDRFRLICLCEPWRTPWSLALSRTMMPFVGTVTKHDMPASIEAGFRPGELSRFLNLQGWNIRESVDFRGSIRLVAWRN